MRELDATCPVGTTPVGGGVRGVEMLSPGAMRWIYVKATYPTATGWHVLVENDGGTGYEVFAVCWRS